MTQRAYTVREIDELRSAVETEFRIPEPWGGSDMGAMTDAGGGLSREEFLAARVLYLPDEMVPDSGIGWTQSPAGEKIVLVGKSYRERYEFWRNDFEDDGAGG